jgi:oxygen-independent coproporphyrinogen III oxidase
MLTEIIQPNAGAAIAGGGRRRGGAVDHRFPTVSYDNPSEIIAEADPRTALMAKYEGRAPRYTSYPTAVQFTPAVDAAVYGDWLAALPVAEPVSIYAHIPFCERMCWYCGCNTRVVNRAEPISEYVALLTREIEMVAERLPGRLRMGSVHLGGGTPNTLSPADLDRLFGKFHDVFSTSADLDIAAEIDPARLRPEWVRAAAAIGLNRASLGVQDLSPHVQAAVNRIEPFAVVERAFDLLRTAGVDDINVDLMYGLPLQTTSDLLHTLDQVLTLKPGRLALFGYAHVPWMKAHQKLIREADLPGPLARLDQADAAARRLEAEGYRRIGLDHFARPTDALTQQPVRRNFQGYTTDPDMTLLGFGASAIGRLPQGHVQNQSAELAWRQAIQAGRLATARGVGFTADDLFRGEIIERLMCDLAVDLHAVRARHGVPADAIASSWEALAGFERDGLVTIAGETLAITETGRPFMRAVCAVFDAYLNPAAARHSTVV